MHIIQRTCRRAVKDLARAVIGGLLLGWLIPELQAEATWVYAVQISATVQTAPARITLRWDADPFGATNYTVYRKTKDAAAWGPGVSLPGSATNYTDSAVTAGAAYEYQIIKAATLGYTGYGYIYTGIQAPLIENRGKLVLVAESTAAAILSNELARLRGDLIGDGWEVGFHTVSSNATPASVKGIITNAYHADPTNVKAVFLCGHVPIFRSGQLNYDGHQARPMPADAYYGDMDGGWTNDPSYLPSDVELMVGRVDLWNMPGRDAPAAWPSEMALLRNYLNKDHQWRHKLMPVSSRALMANRIGDFGGEAFAASGFRSLSPLVGTSGIAEANVQDAAPPEQRWISILATNAFLWTYGCGGGGYTLISQLGTNGLFHDVWSTDIVGQDAKAVFTMLFGSWMGEWDTTDNIMRAVLATPTMGLTCSLSGRPHWFFHHMGLGEPIGYSTRLTMNNSTRYQNQTNLFTRGVHIALMGDPTLRMYPVVPASGLSGQMAANGVTLNWTASPDATLGYHVYRAPAPSGPFARLTSALLTGTQFTDANASSNTYTYMVRAVKHETTPSGTFQNPSQGVFTTVTATSAPLPATVMSIRRSANGVVLGWNSQIGQLYQVLAKDNLSLSNLSWINLSGSIIASGTNTFWTNAGASATAERYYRIVRP